MKKYAKVINEETKACEVGLGTNNNFYASIGMAEMEVEQAYNGAWYLAGFAPIKPAPTNEEIKAERERLYVLYADKLKNDYDEDVARYGLESSEALASKKIWLDKKDEIRENNHYNADEEI